MKKKYLAAALVAILLVVAVAAGVHVLNKKAHADTLVSCKVTDGQQVILIEGMLHVHFYMDDQLIEGGEMEIDGNFYTYLGPPQTQYDS